MRILVIDDDELVARAVQRRLREHEVTIETGPTKAVGLVEAAARQGQPFEAVVCDVYMPGASGPEVLATLRAHEDPPMLILMSGYDEVVDAALVADAVLVKPFSTSDIIETVERIRAQRARTTTRRLRRLVAPVPSSRSC